MPQTQNFQSLKNGTLFHYFVLPMLFINLVSSIMHTVRHFSADAVIAVLLAAALLLLALHPVRSRSPFRIASSVSKCSCVSRSRFPPTYAHASRNSR